jgi:hypothetical protein
MVKMIMIAALALMGCEACVPRAVPAAAAAVIECTAENQDAIAALVLEFRTLLSGDLPDWSAVEARAIRAGRVIGGCALAHFVDALIAEPRAFGPASIRDAVSIPQACAVLDRFRSRYGGIAYQIAGEGVCHGA